MDLSKLEPTVACHPDPGQRKKAKDMDMKLEDVKIEQLGKVKKVTISKVPLLA